ncbi:unnamed protein product [Cylindrotheca closterium]|uniref:Uncharacterized protein n=1 Tax=Cylindrotheca closterium TaxID=2856 RepID=A0AAD2FQC3_9STRA|nr:unnamed protein product [Cylindrotheca closterium]
MATILLTCNSEDFDIALCLKSSIQNELGIKVCLHIEDDSDDEDEGLDAMVELATVLLVFEFGDSNISAWVTIDGIDIAQSNYQQSAFPEAIDFSKNFAKGVAVLDDILYTDFGLDTRARAHVQPQQHFAQLTV